MPAKNEVDVLSHSPENNVKHGDAFLRRNTFLIEFIDGFQDNDLKIIGWQKPALVHWSKSLTGMV